MVCILNKTLIKKIYFYQRIVGSLSCPVLHPRRVGGETDDEADDAKDEQGYDAHRKRLVFVEVTTTF